MSVDIISQKFTQIISSLVEDKSVVVSDDMSLIGANGIIDSMKLVELCLLLEDLSVDLGFQFDWTSETALSKSRSMFRTISALKSEFISQMQSSK